MDLPRKFNILRYFAIFDSDYFYEIKLQVQFKCLWCHFPISSLLPSLNLAYFFHLHVFTSVHMYISVKHIELLYVFLKIEEGVLWTESCLPKIHGSEQTSFSNFSFSLYILVSRIIFVDMCKFSSPLFNCYVMFHFMNVTINLFIFLLIDIKLFVIFHITNCCVCCARVW